MKLYKNSIITLFFILSFTAFQTHAGLIFDFTIDELQPLNHNLAIGDTFSMTFADDSNFGSTLTLADFELISWNLASIGSASWVPTSGIFSNHSDIFDFTSLGGGEWQLDLILGVTGQTSAAFPNDGGVHAFQVGQTISGSGPLSLYFQGGTGIAYMHNSDESFILTSQTIATVPEPGSLALLGLGLLSLLWSRWRMRL